jgi:phage terminase small subunit
MAIGSGRKALTEDGVTSNQELFCRYYLELSGDGTAAAIKAGYAKRNATGQQWELLQNKRVRARIHTLTKEGFATAGAEAFQVVMDLMRNSKSDTVRLRAATDIMDRAGHKPLEALLSVDESDALNEDDLVQKIREAMANLGHAGFTIDEADGMRDITPIKDKSTKV